MKYVIYLDALELSCRRMTRAELRRFFWLGTGRQVPKGANLRKFVPAWHRAQMAIKQGRPASKFWKRAVGVAA